MRYCAMNLMTPHAKQQLLKLIEQMPTATRCVDCVHLQGKLCSLAGIVPPPEVMESGCEGWEFNVDGPPF